jgi:hypothetical protein
MEQNKKENINIEKATKIIKKYGKDMFASNLCSSNLIVIEKKNKLFFPKKEIVFLSDDCANQIVTRYALNKLRKVITTTITIGHDSFSNIEPSETYLEEIFEKIDSIYNNKQDSQQFDEKVHKFAKYLQKIEILEERSDRESSIIFLEQDEMAEFQKLCEYFRKFKIKKDEPEISL